MRRGYADSYGYQSDQLCPTWPYRDWVVGAFNRNLPYDRFLVEQLAGDLLPNPTREQRLATAFNRLHRQTNEGGSIEEEWRNEYVSDRVHTFSTTFLALTFECARCHDHKFDPISQRDYYSLSAFFNSIDEYGLYNDTAPRPDAFAAAADADQEKAMAATEQTLNAKTKRPCRGHRRSGTRLPELAQKQCSWAGLHTARRGSHPRLEEGGRNALGGRRDACARVRRGPRSVSPF